MHSTYENSQPSFIDNNLLVSILVNSLTALLCVRSADTITLLRNLDDRVNHGRTVPETNCSFQVANAYYSYLEFLEIIDKPQFDKYPRI